MSEFDSCEEKQPTDYPHTHTHTALHENNSKKKMQRAIFIVQILKTHNSRSMIRDDATCLCVCI